VGAVLRAAAPRRGGLFDTAHRTRPGTVVPLGWVDVEPADFPLADLLVSHEDDEPIWRTFLNARRRAAAGRP
jgi:hypothetical protein